MLTLSRFFEATCFAAKSTDVLLKGGVNMFKVDSDKIRSMIFAKGLSLNQFAQKSGLNALTVCKLVRDGTTTTAKTIGTLAKFFNVDGNNFILKAEKKG